jgi:lysophospholipase L1-like esterase
VLAEQPEIVILALGANDGLQSLSPTDAKARLTVMIENLQKNNYLNYERHIKFLDEADKTITNQFWKRLWLESSESLI